MKQEARAKTESFGTMEAITQLGQDALRNGIGNINRDHIFGERRASSRFVAAELEKDSEPWGVNVLSYAIRNIKRPRGGLNATESQVHAEREKHAAIS
jgi:regulator of protease activity HflC (stomatin/prohibitin superfamily)